MIIFPTFWWKCHLPNMPEQQRAIGSSTGKEPLMNRMPGHSWNWVKTQSENTTLRFQMNEWKKIRVPNTFILIQTLIKIYNKFWPVASFLWPLKTWSSSFRLRMSKSLQRWSREAVSSQLPFRFSFTSMTVFLWACLQAENKKRLFVHILTSQTQIKYDYLPVPNIQVNVSNSGY